MKRFALSLLSFLLPLSAQNAPTQIVCGNLVYGNNQTSVCFASTFLGDAAKATKLDILTEFKRINLKDEEVFSTPVCIFTGEGNFVLSQQERDHLKRYVMNGGFIIASPGCSDATWNKAFRRELEAVLPGYPIEPLAMEHEVFSTVTKITPSSVRTGNGKTVLNGITVNGRLAILYSPEGLNDVRNAKGCCCCGGSEIKGAREINTNALVYALLH
jgi:hypothetical protein